MVRDALKTLLHPFESGILPAPGAGARLLFLGAEPGFRLPEGFDCELSLVQGFRPDFLALQRAGHSVGPVPEGSDYSAALILCGRHRGRNELWIAEALERTADGGLVVIAGARDDGTSSLARRIAGIIPFVSKAPKHHGLAFWFSAPVDRAAIARDIRQANRRAPVEGRFQTGPGMFSHDHVDPGSKLLAGALASGVSGNVADFCAGWGYVAAQIMIRCPEATSVDLYEADFVSLEAARLNVAGTPSIVAGTPSVETRFFWHDLVGEPVDARYDAIVMNPPFHLGRAAQPEIGRQLIAVAAAALKPRGTLHLVANRHLPYEGALAAAFSRYEEIAGDGAFKVLQARK
jgi:16S rRNA (guanine1207-N2)-methyltransferase